MKILFIHHSTGGNLINQGKLRKQIAEIDPSIELWDHGYNVYKNTLIPNYIKRLTFHTGLSDNNGKQTGKDYNIILSNNSPKEYAEIFSRDPQDATLKQILRYDVIAFKNCYPTTKITSQEQLEIDKHCYSSIRESIKKYPDKKFILITPPPLRKDLTTQKNAQRAKTLVTFLNSDGFLQKAKNLFVFDFFTLLSDEDGYLKKEYTRMIPFDSHPNTKANKAIAPLLAKYLVEIAHK